MKPPFYEKFPSTNTWGWVIMEHRSSVNHILPRMKKKMIAYGVFELSFFLKITAKKMRGFM